MEIIRKKIDTFIIIMICCYLFFLSRRGGDTKDIFSLLIMGSVLVYSFKNGIENYLKYKKEVLISLIYLSFVIFSYIIEPEKNSDKLYTFLHTTLYSVGFMVVLFNYKLENKYIKLIIPVLILLSCPSIFKGIKDFYFHLEEFKDLASYRIAGDTYTTRYAAELGIYFLLGMISMFYYKKAYIKILAFIYTACNLILIFGTQSRNTFLAIPIVLIIMFILVDWKKGLIVSLIILGSTGLLFKYSHNIGNVSRIKNSISTIEKIKKDARYGLFIQGINESKETIFKGKGFFHFKGNKIERPEMNLDHYHNNFIETAVTQGVLALIVYIIFLFTLFVRMIKNYFSEKDRNKKYIKLLAISVFIFSNLYGLFEPIFYMEKIYQLVFTIITIGFIVKDEKE